MKLSEWGKEKGISCQTALRWIKVGQFPDRFEKLPSGMINVIPAEATSEPLPMDGVFIYYGRRSSRHRAKQALSSAENYKKGNEA